MSRLSAEVNLNPEELKKKLTAVAAQAEKSASALDSESVSRQSEGSNANQALSNEDLSHMSDPGSSAATATANASMIS